MGKEGGTGREGGTVKPGRGGDGGGEAEGKEKGMKSLPGLPYGILT